MSGVTRKYWTTEVTSPAQRAATSAARNKLRNMLIFSRPALVAGETHGVAGVVGTVMEAVIACKAGTD
jgi:hypothetical protein